MQDKAEADVSKAEAAPAEPVPEAAQKAGNKVRLCLALTGISACMLLNIECSMFCLRFSLQQPTYDNKVSLHLSRFWS